MLRKRHWSLRLFLAFKWATVLFSMLFGVLVMVFCTANLDLPMAPSFGLFGFFCTWCGYSLAQSLRLESAREKQFLQEDDDESSYF